MKFGVFDYIDDRGEPLQETFEDRLALLQAAEAAGFYGYHLTEHHATPLSMTPSPSVFLAAAARAEYRKVKVAPGNVVELLERHADAQRTITDLDGLIDAAGV